MINGAVGGVFLRGPGFVSKRGQRIVGRALRLPICRLATEAVALQQQKRFAPGQSSFGPQPADADKSRRYLDRARLRGGRSRPMSKQRAERSAAWDAPPEIHSAW